MSQAQEKFKNFSSLQKVRFFNLLLRDINNFGKEVFKVLKKIVNINLGTSNHPEICYTWFQVALAMKDEEAIEPAKKFLAKQGRMRYLRPVFRELYRLDKENTIVFLDSVKHLYHPVATRMIQVEFGRIDNEK